MERPGKKAAILAAVFASVAALGAGYYYRHDIIFELCDLVHPAWNAGEQRLTDAYGRRYTLMNVGDGTETALYDDDTAVNFKRDEAGNLIWQYGTASLLAPIAANYFAFHGMSYPGGSMDVAAMTYRPNGMPEALPQPPETKHGAGGVPRRRRTRLLGAQRLQLRRQEERECKAADAEIRLWTRRGTLVRTRFVRNL